MTRRPSLRIGILGAARIANRAIVQPAAQLGHTIHAVASRDVGRGEAFARAHGIGRVFESYAALIADDEIDLVYNALVNSLHHRWNVAALEAGKVVLSEKPLSSNASQTRHLRDVAASTTGRLIEGFHYIHHPIHRRLRAIVTSGAIGDVHRVELAAKIPRRPADDPRWRVDLAGGATMDIGCYALDAARVVGTWIGAGVTITSAKATLEAPDLDSAMTTELSFGRSAVGRADWGMGSTERSTSWTIRGTDGSVTSPSFVVPHNDNRLLLERSGVVDEETHGTESSYFYQLEHVAAAVRSVTSDAFDLTGSVETAELVDSAYRAADLEPRASD